MFLNTCFNLNEIYIQTICFHILLCFYQGLVFYTDLSHTPLIISVDWYVTIFGLMEYQDEFYQGSTVFVRPNSKEIDKNKY